MEREKILQSRRIRINRNIFNTSHSSSKVNSILLEVIENCEAMSAAISVSIENEAKRNMQYSHFSKLDKSAE